MRNNSPDSLENKKFFNQLRFSVGLFELLSEHFAHEYQRKQLLKEWVEAFLKEKEATKPTQYQAPIDAPQRKEFKEKVESLFDNLNAIVEKFIQQVSKISETAIAAGYKVVDRVLADKKSNIPVNSVEVVHKAARKMVDDGYHVPTVMNMAKGILTPSPTPATTQEKTHSPYTVADEKHFLSDAHESLHGQIKTARNDLVKSLEEKAYDEFFNQFARLTAYMSHARALHKACNTHAEHRDVFINIVDVMLRSAEHVQYLKDMSHTTRETLAAGTTRALKDDPTAAMGNFFSFFPPTPQPRPEKEQIDDGYRTPFRTKPNPYDSY